MSAALKMVPPAQAHQDDSAPFRETRVLIEALAADSDLGRKLRETFGRERFELARAESRTHRMAQAAMERFDEVVPKLVAENKLLRARLGWAVSHFRTYAR